jgi:hypothetical protein
MGDIKDKLLLDVLLIVLEKASNFELLNQLTLAQSALCLEKPLVRSSIQSNDCEYSTHDEVDRLLTGCSTSILGTSIAPTVDALLATDTVQELLPLIEAELEQMCRLLAKVSEYDDACADFSGIPDHLRLLLRAGAASEATAASETENADLASQYTQALRESALASSGVIKNHLLGPHKEALHLRKQAIEADVSMVSQKSKTILTQLRSANYTPATLPALKIAAKQVDSALIGAKKSVIINESRLEQCEGLGPEFALLAKRHAQAKASLQEVTFQLQEIQRFQEKV